MFGPLILAAGFNSLNVSAQGAESASFPNKPIQLVMGFPPGGSGDFIARLIAEEMAKLLGQNVLPINRPGGATNIAKDSGLTLGRIRSQCDH